MKSFGIGFIVLILAVIILLANSLFIVTDKQTAILLRFGEIIDPKKLKRSIFPQTFAKTTKPNLPKI